MHYSKAIVFVLLSISSFTILKGNNAVTIPNESLFADTLFTVVKIEGRVTNTRTGKVLKEKDQFLSSDSLIFDSENIVLVVVNKRAETYDLIPKKDLVSHYTGLSKERVGTRPGKFLNYLSLTRFLKGRRYLILGGRSEIQVGEKEFPMNEDHFFYIQYDWVGDTLPVNKKLDFRGDTLIIDKAEFLKVSGQPIPFKDAKNFKLFYYDLEKTESLFINKMDLIFVDEGALKSEIQTIIESMEEKGCSKLFKGIDNYIIRYGEPKISELKKWLLHHFGIDFNNC